MEDLATAYELPTAALGYLTAAVQFGFITGTLVFAIAAIADRFSPSRVFMWCAFFAALANLTMLWSENTLTTLLSGRFLTGFFLAGIYPVGMKIAADYYQAGLGKSLGFLVGALVLGTAFPHLLKAIGGELSWEMVQYGTSGIALLGGLMIGWFVPDGPYRKPSQQIQLTAFIEVFRNREFRRAAFGYFGHMWELYTFWALIPFLVRSFSSDFPTSMLSFLILGIGAVGCVLGGYLSYRYGTGRVAYYALAASGLCCLVLPLVFTMGNSTVFLLFMLFWGLTVVADSPLFSTLVAQRAPDELRGTALTIVTCVGFGITIISLLLLTDLLERAGTVSVITILSLGPLFGLLTAWQRSKRNSSS